MTSDRRIGPEQPPSGSEWSIRYRVLGQSAVWPDKTVCEVLTGPRAGTKWVLDPEDFSERLQRGRRTRGT